MRAGRCAPRARAGRDQSGAGPVSPGLAEGTREVCAFGAGADRNHRDGPATERAGGAWLVTVAGQSGERDPRQCHQQRGLGIEQWQQVRLVETCQPAVAHRQHRGQVRSVGEQPDLADRFASGDVAQQAAVTKHAEASAQQQEERVTVLAFTIEVVAAVDPYRAGAVDQALTHRFWQRSQGREAHQKCGYVLLHAPDHARGWASGQAQPDVQP